MREKNGQRAKGHTEANAAEAYEFDGCVGISFDTRELGNL